MDPLLEDSTFRCRKCRLRLFSVKKLQSHKDQKVKRNLAAGPLPVDLSSYDKCSSWFLSDEDMLPWITESVEEAQWTEGKLYCPKCKSRIGAFDFIHGIQCNCGKFIIPAVWIQKSRVDHILRKAQATNLEIRKPVVNPDQSARTHSNVTSAVTHNASDLCGGNIQEFDDIDSTQNRRRGGDPLQFASSSVSSSSNYTDEGNEGKDHGQAECSCNTCPRVNRESASSSCDLFIPLESNITIPPQGTNIPHCIGLKNIQQCEERFDAKLHQVHPAGDDERIQTLSSRCSCTCTYCMDASLESNSSPRTLVHTLNSKESHVQRSKRKRKGRHLISLENADFDLHGEMNIEPQVTQAGDQKTYYSCLTVDDGFDETMTTRIKVATAEIQDRHSCAVCLDLLYEPFKCSCDHVFCDPCLRQLNFRTNSRGTIRCPLCRQIVEHITPATELRTEIRGTYDSHILRKRDKAERRAPHRKWPLPANHGIFRRVECLKTKSPSATRASALTICVMKPKH